MVFTALALLYARSLRNETIQKEKDDMKQYDNTIDFHTIVEDEEELTNRELTDMDEDTALDKLGLTKAE